MHDYVVIGGGIAGVSAALAARASGATAALVRAAPGATALSSGGWNGSLPDLVARALEDAALPYVPVAAPLAHPFGDLRTYSFAAEPHARAHATEDSLVCGIAGLSGFVAPALARFYATSNDRPLQHVTLEIAETPPAGWSPFALAALLEKRPELLAAALAGFLARTDRMPSHALFPAVLGLEKHDAVRAAIAITTGIPVFECLGAPPSLPGWRLDRALQRALRNAGVEVINDRVSSIASEAGCITGVVLAGHTALLRGGRFVLATGKFIGAGIGTSPASSGAARIATAGGASGAAAHARARSRAQPVEQHLVEAAFGLPVWIDHLGQSFSTAESLTLTSRVRTYDQPLLKVGVHVNAQQQPVDARGRVLYSNVTVAGGVEAGVTSLELSLGAAAARGIAAVSHDVERAP